MKKILTVLLLLLAAVCCATAACAAGTAAKGQVKATLEVIGAGNWDPVVTIGETVYLSIQIQNTSGEDFASEMYLFDPAKQNIHEFPLLKAGESAWWRGKWTITEEDARTGGLKYRIQYYYTDENGQRVATGKNMIRRIAVKAAEEATPEPTPVPTPEPTPRPEDRPRIVAYSILKPDDQNEAVNICCLDEAGDFWSGDYWDPDFLTSDEEVFRILQGREAMNVKQNMTGPYYFDNKYPKTDFFKGLGVMASQIPETEATPKKTGENLGTNEIWAMQYDPDGNPKPVLLGVSGSFVFENTDPNAQELYRIMWRMERMINGFSYGYAAEGLTPHGFEPVSVREFFSLENADAETAVITGYLTDCEEGLIEAKLTEEDRKKALALLERGVVIGKENPWMVTGGTMRYVFHDPEGNYLGCIETYEYDSLAVKNDGMYRLSILPPPADSLPEEEAKLLNIRIGGVEYTMGKSTPRDLIRNGWFCRIADDGTFEFPDIREEGYGTFYVSTPGGSVDEPISSIVCQFAYDMPIEYGGFDGYVNPEDPEDMDTVWRIKRIEELKAEIEANGEDESEYNLSIDPWEGCDEEEKGTGTYFTGMEDWIKTLGEEDPDSDNGTSVDVVLSDGHTLRVFSAESRVNLSMGYEGYIRLGPEEDW
jgi:hypothetical protein